MALNIGEKKDVVKEISEIASSAQSAVAAEYRGLTVSELSVLRDNARDLGVYVGFPVGAFENWSESRSRTSISVIKSEQEGCRIHESRYRDCW